MHCLFIVSFSDAIVVIPVPMYNPMTDLLSAVLSS